MNGGLLNTKPLRYLSLTLTFEETAQDILLASC